MTYDLQPTTNNFRSRAAKLWSKVVGCKSSVVSPARTDFFYRKHPSGQVMLIVVIFFLGFSLALMLGFVEPIIRSTQSAGELKLSDQSYYAAESLSEDLAYRLKTGETTASTESLTVGSSTASATVTSNLGTQTITSLGTDSTLKREVSLSLTEAAGVAFNYGIQAGEGGFVLSGGATVNGNVYANGDIMATTGVNINGSAVAADSAATSTNQSNDTPSTPASSIIFGNVTASQDVAQSFQVSTDGPLSKIDVYLKKVGAPGNLTVRITTDSSGKPATSDIVNTTLSASLVTTSYGWVSVTLPTAVELQAGTTYWLILDGSANSSKYYTIGANSSYSNGSALLGTFGGTWSNTSPSGLDAYFHIYLGGLTSMIGGDTYSGGVVIQNDAWANYVQGATVSGNLYCKTGSTNNKSCNTSKSDPTPQSMPVSDGDIAQWKSDATAGGTITGDETVGFAGATLGPTVITGNLTVNGGGTLTVAGTIWVKGTLTVTGGGKIKLSSSYGSGSGVIVTDGIVNLGGGGALTGSGVSGSYLMIVTTSDCPFDSSCPSTPAMTLSGGASSVILNAQNGDLTISGGSSLNEATAYQISVNGGATLNYSSGLANLFFTSGPSGGYSINSWQETLP